LVNFTNANAEGLSLTSASKNARSKRSKNNKKQQAAKKKIMKDENE
jgi:hypothetical protein